MIFHYALKSIKIFVAICTITSFLHSQATISISNPSVSEGNSGTTNVTFSVICNPCASVNAIIDWRINDGSATIADGDYNDSSGQIDDMGNGSGVETVDITVQVNGDTKVESDETFVLELYNVSVGAPSLLFQNNKRTGTALIINDDEVEDTERPPSHCCSIWDIILWIVIILLILLGIGIFRSRRATS